MRIRGVLSSETRQDTLDAFRVDHVGWVSLMSLPNPSTTAKAYQTQSVFSKVSVQNLVEVVMWGAHMSLRVGMPYPPSLAPAQAPPPSREFPGTRIVLDTLSCVRRDLVAQPPPEQHRESDRPGHLSDRVASMTRFGPGVSVSFLFQSVFWLGRPALLAHRSHHAAVGCS